MHYFAQNLTFSVLTFRLDLSKYAQKLQLARISVCYQIKSLFKALRKNSVLMQITDTKFLAHFQRKYAIVFLKLAILMLLI